MPNYKEYQGFLGDNLRRLRSERRMGQNAFAKFLGIGNNAFVALEENRANPQLDTLCQIASALHVEPWHLLIEGLDVRNAPAAYTEDQFKQRVVAQVVQAFPQDHARIERRAQPMKQVAHKRRNKRR